MAMESGLGDRFAPPLASTIPTRARPRRTQGPTANGRVSVDRHRRTAARALRRYRAPTGVSTPVAPEALRAVDKAEFLRRLPELDPGMTQRCAAAAAEGQVLRYVARLDCAGDSPRATVGLVAVPREHALATIRPTDNVVQFTTERYRSNPLVVRGPGAGPDVTAMGIFADLLRVATTLGGERLPADPMRARQG